MPKDYKHRIRGKNTLSPQDFDPVGNLSVWRWMLITIVTISAVVLLVYSITKDPKETLTAKQVVNKQAVNNKTPPEKTERPVQFDFYTILPKKEVVVPDYEIKTRTREEQVGQKGSSKKYLLQAGSFNGLREAEHMLNRLANMGIEAKIQKARVGNTVWYRVKLGPYAQISSVNSIHARLKQNGIDAIITETDK